MKILIITTYFPPDTSIAAVRPYMFAKYLTKFGHEVTVVRSGEIDYKADNSWPIDGAGFKVFSYLGENSPAERYRRGEPIETKMGKGRSSFLPEFLQKPAGELYHRLFYKHELDKIRSKVEVMKSSLLSMKKNGQSFDVVFATYGELENVFAGEYAAKLFNSKYILDLRDPIAQRIFQNRKRFKLLTEIQRDALLASDVCTCVSEAVASEMRKYAPEKKIVALNNGYEPADMSDFQMADTKNADFSFCYTGMFYPNVRDASRLFHALSDICRDGKIDKDKLRFYYAGMDFGQLLKQAKAYEMESILVNKGYIGREDVFKLQSESDIFIVLSWNTDSSHGVLPGKLYEGIRCKRPILSIVSGNEENSELSEMNRKYHYGFCYEQANHSNDFPKLKDWILDLYQQKMAGEDIPNLADPAFAVDFRYDTLAARLEGIMQDLLISKQ